MESENLGIKPPSAADPEKRKVAAQKSSLTRQIHNLEIAVRQLATTGPEAAEEIARRKRELWEKQVERNALDGLPPPPEPVADNVTEGAVTAEPIKEISIKEAQSFKELYQAIGTTHGIAPGFADFSGGLKNADGRFGAKGFEDLIRRVRRGEASIQSIPTDYGIREKVAELLPIDTDSSDDDVVAPALLSSGDTAAGEMMQQVQADSIQNDAEIAEKNLRAWREQFGPLAEMQEESEALAHAENVTLEPTHDAVDTVSDLKAEEQRAEESLMHLVDQYEDRERSPNVLSAQSAADRIMHDVEEEVRFRGEGRLEDVRSRWQRMSQATRDATLLPIVATSNWLARRPQWQKYAGAGLVGVLVYAFFDKNYGEHGVVPMGPEGMPPDAVSHVPAPQEVKQSWMDKFREWFQGAPVVPPDNATVGPEIASPAAPESIDITSPEMVAPVSPEAASGVFEHVVKRGDTVWSIVQHMLPEKFPASVFAKLGPEQVAYIVDGLKDSLEKMTPQQLKEFGIASGNIGKIFPGDTINFSKLFENQTLLNDLLEKARSLTQEQIQNIARNIRLGRM